MKAAIGNTLTVNSRSIALRVAKAIPATWPNA